MLIDSKCFSSTEQQNFAGISGDYNPFHIDDVLARRMISGSTVVHGINLILWALDRWLSGKDGIVSITDLNVSFLKPVLTGETVELLLKKSEHNISELEIYVKNNLRVSFTLEWNTKSAGTGKYKECLPAKESPSELDEYSIQNNRGKIILHLKSEATSKIYPNLVRLIPANQIAFLLATTRLVGMKCPGLNSIFSALKITTSDNINSDEFEYEVSKYDSRFKLVLIAISSGCLKGEIKALLRPKKVEQTDFKTIKTNYHSNDFQEQKAIIIGGSRGLGEVAAKLLSAGNADVLITYNKGVKEAERIVKEIVGCGGKVNATHLDIQSINNRECCQYITEWKPTHLYYFPTPFIFLGVKHVFSIDLFNKFISYYVDSFFNLVKVLYKVGLRNIFYPSTVAINELPTDMIEYSLAKIAGEQVCLFLEKMYPDLRIHKHRLPRLATDQTVSVVSVNNLDPIPFVLNVLYDMNNGKRIL